MWHANSDTESFVSESHGNLRQKFGLLSMNANCSWLVAYNCGVLIQLVSYLGVVTYFGIQVIVLLTSVLAFVELQFNQCFVDYSHPLPTYVKCVKLMNLESFLLVYSLSGGLSYSLVSSCVATLKINTCKSYLHSCYI